MLIGRTASSPIWKSTWIANSTFRRAGCDKSLLIQDFSGGAEKSGWCGIWLFGMAAGRGRAKRQAAIAKTSATGIQVIWVSKRQ